jgi:sugar phosphate isomerase/epimerase
MMESVFTLAYSTIGSPDYDVDQIIALALRCGLPGVELRFVRGTTEIEGLPEFQGQGLADTRRRFDDAGLKVVAIDSSVRMNAIAPDVRAQNLELARATAGIAAALGAPYVRVFGGAIPEGQSEAETRDAIVAGLSEVAELTAESGVQSILETHDSYSTSDSIVGLFEAGASDKLGVLWDSLHTYRHGETAEESWAKLGPRVRHVHLKDSTQANPDTFDFALVGEGIVPIPHIVEVLTDAGYDGAVSFEWEKGWHPEIAEADVAVPAFAEYMQTLLAR